MKKPCTCSTGTYCRAHGRFGRKRKLRPDSTGQFRYEDLDQREIELVILYQACGGGRRVVRRSAPY